MANEISVIARLQIASEGTTAQGWKNLTLDLSGSQFMADVQSVSTVTEVVSFGDLSDLRYAWLYNPSSTASVTVSAAATVLRPGDVMVFPPSSTAVTLQATAASTDVHKVLTET